MQKQDRFQNAFELEKFLSKHKDKKTPGPLRGDGAGEGVGWNKAASIWTINIYLNPSVKTYSLKKTSIFLFPQ